ncbi:MAG: DUF2339 domain-containing protein [Eubacterium sp.]
MSTDKAKRLNQLISEQEQILQGLKEEAKAVNDNSLVEENERLTAALRAEKTKSDALEKESEALKKQLSTAKSALFAKMADEKLSAFMRTQKKIDAVYYYDADGVGSRLAEYERGCRKSIHETIKVIEGYGSTQYDDIMAKLRALNNELDCRHNQVEQFKTQQVNSAVNTNNSIGESLKNEPLSENEKRTALKQKSLESFIGLNVLSKAGILLFLVGIIMLGRYAYVHMSDVFRGGLIYALGAVLIAVGELFHKKEKTVFSTALISGGVSVLYAAAATCYFAFSLYSVKTAFVICIAVTACAIALSQQLKSQVVCAFAAVGGYLPVVAVFMIGFGKAASDITFLPVASVYFCMLAVIIFAMTYNKKWYAAQYIGYALHLIAIGGVAGCAWMLSDLAGYGYTLPLAAGFAIASFIIYLLMPSVKIIKRKELGSGDLALLGVNTVSGAISVSITVHNCFAEQSTGDRAVGFVFLIFAIIYALLMTCSVRQKSSASKVSGIITSIGALIFSMLVIPFVFGIEYAPVAWAAEGAILAVISIERNIRTSEFAGLACMLLSVLYVFFGTEYIGTSSYSVLSIITLCVIIVSFWGYTVCGILSGRSSGRVKAVYIVSELFSAAGTFGYLCYLYQCAVHGPVVHLYSDFTDYALGVLFALAVAAAIRYGILKNNVSVLFSNIIGLVLPITVFIAVDLITNYNRITGYYGFEVKSKGFEIFNLMLLVIINIAVGLFFAKSLSSLLSKIQAPMWIYTAAISVISLMLITASVMNQFDVAFSSVIISALYIAAACVLLFIGFKKRYTVVRSGGLVLILCAFAKLCFVDTMQLDSAWKIASYFAFGALLIVISYFYQRFSKKLEREAEKIAENNK